ncbi:MAG: microcin C ABC transporter permease YejB [Alphaproteobacteria bacterium]|nr:microcin C ABC transporter permease YejB [Alphaproteobacteria bacterium]
MDKAYFLKRLALIPLTLFGIMAINFLIVQLAPGGPVEQLLAKAEQGAAPSAVGRIAGGAGDVAAGNGLYRGGQGMQDDLRRELEARFGFDQPAGKRFLIMMKNYALFDFGKSFYQDKSVIRLILDKLPVSVSLGVFSTLLIYLISIPLGIRKAVRKSMPFDRNTSWMLIVAHAVPSFLLAIFLLIFFAGGRYLSWFPLRGIVSDGWADMSAGRQILDYLWHMALPVLSLTIGGLAGLTFLTKNAFLEELGKQYCRTARAKGCTQRQVLWGHVFRNAMLIVIAGFPSMLIGMLFTGSVLIEVIFSLDGLGLLGFEAVQNRDYPVVFGTLYLFALLGLALNLISDYIYTRVDPRIHFEARKQ